MESNVPFLPADLKNHFCRKWGHRLTLPFVIIRLVGFKKLTQPNLYREPYAISYTYSIYVRQNYLFIAILSILLIMSNFMPFSRHESLKWYGSTIVLSLFNGLSYQIIIFHKGGGGWNSPPKKIGFSRFTNDENISRNKNKNSAI